MNLFEIWCEMNDVVHTWRTHFNVLREQLPKAASLEEARDLIESEGFLRAYPKLPEKLEFEWGQWFETAIQQIESDKSSAEKIRRLVQASTLPPPACTKQLLRVRRTGEVLEMFISYSYGRLDDRLTSAGFVPRPECYYRLSNGTHYWAHELEDAG